MRRRQSWRADTRLIRKIEQLELVVFGMLPDLIASERRPLYSCGRSRTA